MGTNPFSAGHMRLFIGLFDHRGMNTMPQQMGVEIESVVVVNVEDSIHEDADSLN